MNRPLLAAALAAAVAAPVGLAVGQAQVIQARQEAMKAMSESVQAIQRVVQAGGPADAAVAPARVVAEHAPRIKTLFPPGSDQGARTRALPTIWSDRAGFERYADTLATQASALLAAAQGNDTAALGRALQAAGETCGACHRANRAPQR
jgi:cytochrome c556